MCVCPGENEISVSTGLEILMKGANQIEASLTGILRHSSLVYILWILPSEPCM